MMAKELPLYMYFLDAEIGREIQLFSKRVQDERSFLQYA